MVPIETEVRVRALRVQCRIGVPEAERAERQTVAVDVAVHLGSLAVAEDAMAASLNYRDVVLAVRGLAAEREFLLLETLAAAVAERVFAADARVECVDVTCEKPHKYADCEAVGVRRAFGRDRSVP